MAGQKPSSYLAKSPFVKALSFEGDGLVPNNPRFPLLAYKEVLGKECRDKAEVFEALYLENGWDVAWRWGVYTYHHYHATVHEVLGCFRGTASILFGGEQGEVVKVETGDLVVIPAGVGHKNLDCSSDFEVAGSYPIGFGVDQKRDTKADHDVSIELIAKVPVPKEDPLYGETGPLRRLWK